MDCFDIFRVYIEKVIFGCLNYWFFDFKNMNLFVNNFINSFWNLKFLEMVGILFVKCMRDIRFLFFNFSCYLKWNKNDFFFKENKI